MSEQYNIIIMCRSEGAVVSGVTQERCATLPCDCASSGAEKCQLITRDHGRPGLDSSQPSRPQRRGAALQQPCCTRLRAVAVPCCCVRCQRWAPHTANHKYCTVSGPCSWAAVDVSNRTCASTPHTTGPSEIYVSVDYSYVRRHRGNARTGWVRQQLHRPGEVGAASMQICD